MVWIDMLIPSRRRRSRLLRAAESAELDELLSALPIVYRTNPNCVADVDCLLVFYEAMAKHAGKCSAQNFEGLQHIAPREPLEAEQRRRLSRIYVHITEAALKAGLQELAIEFGLPGARHTALDTNHRHTVLAKLVESCCVSQAVLETLHAELGRQRSTVLMTALHKGTKCGLQAPRERAVVAYQLGQVGLELGVSDISLYESVASALLLLGRPAEVIRLLKPRWQEFRPNGNLGFLLALAHFRTGDYAEGAATLGDAAGSKDFPDVRLRATVDAAQYFQRTDHKELPDRRTVLAWVKTLTPKHQTDTVLGAGLAYVRGRLLSLGECLSDAAQCFEEATQSGDDVQMRYYTIHILQLQGRWEQAGTMLNKWDCPEPEIVSLKLKQLWHEKGSLSEEDATHLSGAEHFPNADPLVQARYALCTGQPEDFKCLTTTRRTYREECLRIALAASLGQKDVETSARSLKLLKQPLLASFPRAEQSFFWGVFRWLEGEVDDAQRRLRDAVKQMPFHVGALKCFAAVRLRQGDKRGAAEALSRAAKIGPQDCVTRLRHVLAESTIHPERALDLARSMLDSSVIPEAVALILGRLFLRVAIRGRKASGGKLRRSEAAELAARAFAAAGQTERVQWYRWLVRVLAVPSRDWPTQAEHLLQGRPTGAGAPREARWCEARLQCYVPEFELALNGLQTISQLAIASPHGKARQDVIFFLWRVAEHAKERRQYLDLRAHATKLAQSDPEVARRTEPLLAWLSIQIIDPDASEQTIQRQYQEEGAPEETGLLTRVIQALTTGDAASAHELLSQSASVPAGLAPYLALAKGAVEADAGRVDGLAAVREAARMNGTEDRWAYLEAAARIRDADPTAASCLLDAAKASTSSDGSWHGWLSLSGVLAYLAANASEQTLPEAADWAMRLGGPALKSDPEAPGMYLRLMVIAGKGMEAVKHLEEVLPSADKASEDVKRIRYHIIARAIRDSEFDVAAKRLAAIRPRSDQT